MSMVSKSVVKLGEVASTIDKKNSKNYANAIKTVIIYNNSIIQKKKNQAHLKITFTNWFNFTIQNFI